ncbi:MAG: methyltransferase type 11 [Microvirga sp.]|nr:methyltransferase type 11 [Microvirga sp.]
MDTIAAYNDQATKLATRYELLSSEAVHAALLDFVPRGAGLIALDVGAGSGRDAAWLASLGYDVVAVEPAAAMRLEGQHRHSEARISWVDDKLPDLNAVHGLGISFDLILLSAVWMHVPPHARTRAFRKLVALLKAGALLYMSLREGPSEPDRPMWAAPVGEVEALAREHRLDVLRCVAAADQQGRSGVRWTAICLRLPDEGAAALPLIRGVILNDDKFSTVGCAHRRLSARSRFSKSGNRLDGCAARAGGAELGANEAQLPQLPNNVGSVGLGFAKTGFRELLASSVAPQDLRIGARFSGRRAAAVARAIREARRTIADMPVNYTRFPNSDRTVFRVNIGSPPPVREELND